MTPFSTALPQQHKEATGLFLATALPIALVDGWLWFVALPGGAALPVVAVSHLLLLVLCYANILWYQRNSWDLRFASVMAVMGTLLGPFGFAIAFLSAFFYLLFAGVQLNAATLLAELLPEAQEHAIAETAHRLNTSLDKVDTDTTPVPFLDIMGFGSMEQKRAVISLTLRYFSPEFTSVLRAGLHDKVNGIRVLSATAMVAVERRYYDRFVELKEEVRRFPDDPSVLLAYANHCASFALSDILGEERAAAMRQHAIEAYEALCSGGHASEEVACGLARVYLADHNADRALVTLAPYIAAADVSQECLSLQCQSLFYLRRYADLRLFARQCLPTMADLGATSDEMRSTLMMWAGDKVIA